MRWDPVEVGRGVCFECRSQKRLDFETERNHVDNQRITQIDDDVVLLLKHLETEETQHQQNDDEKYKSAEREKAKSIDSILPNCPVSFIRT